MDIKELPELNETILNVGDEHVAIAENDAPRQSDFIDWLEGFLSAPSLTEAK